MQPISHVYEIQYVTGKSLDDMEDSTAYAVKLQTKSNFVPVLIMIYSKSIGLRGFCLISENEAKSKFQTIKKSTEMTYERISSIMSKEGIDIRSKKDIENKKEQEKLDNIARLVGIPRKYINT